MDSKSTAGNPIAIIEGVISTIIIKIIHVRSKSNPFDS